ncbi:MAG: AAA family ATPase [Asgard group archaeon]|nr:AAA family ATPase [Asgard group archaeon]
MSTLPRVILISGTPGVGKTTIGNILKSKGYPIIKLNELVISEGLYYGHDYTRDSVIIDEDILQDYIVEKLAKISDLVFIEGHTVELIPPKFVDLIIVLRCNPGILRSRLKSSRDYSRPKIEENVQAEIMDECLLNMKEKFPQTTLIEIDTSNQETDEIIDRIIALTLTLK